MTEDRPVHTWLTDMDGVLVHEEEPIPGATDFIDALKASGLRFLVLTNNSIYTPRDLSARLRLSGLTVAPEAIWTSALATARFLHTQRAEGTAFVLGEATVKIELPSCTVRSWEPRDVASLVHHADNRNVWINVRDRFPHPYTKQDGRSFIRHAREMHPETFFAIAVGGLAVGGIGFVLQQDVDRV